MTLRERINSDRKLQLGLGAVILLVVVFVFMKKGGGEETPVAEEPVAAVSETGATLTGETLEVEAVSPEAAGSLASAAAALPAPAMPPAVAAAYKANKVVALLVVRTGGIDDRLVARTTERVAKLPRLKLFVVPVNDVARYGAITLGVDLQRVPALIVMRPKSLSKGGPEASVLYGFQTPASVGQALLDATYHGPEGAYHPGG